MTWTPVRAPGGLAENKRPGRGGEGHSALFPSPGPGQIKTYGRSRNSGVLVAADKLGAVLPSRSFLGLLLSLLAFLRLQLAALPGHRAESRSSCPRYFRDLHKLTHGGHARERGKCKKEAETRQDNSRRKRGGNECGEELPPINLDWENISQK